MLGGLSVWKGKSHLEMMRRGILYTLLFVALVIQAFGQDPELRIVLVSADSLVNVSIDSVQGTTVLMTVGRKPMSVPIDSIARVYTLRPRGVVHGLVIGAFAGAALGFLAGEIIDTQTEKSAPPTLIFSIAGGFAGGIIGSAVALPMRVSSVDLTKKTLDEKRTYLEKFSKEHCP